MFELHERNQRLVLRRQREQERRLCRRRRNFVRTLGRGKFLRSCSRALRQINQIPFSIREKYSNRRATLSLFSSLFFRILLSSHLGQHTVILNSFRCGIYVSRENNILSLLDFFLFGFSFSPSSLFHRRSGQSIIESRLESHPPSDFHSTLLFSLRKVLLD